MFMIMSMITTVAA